MEAANRARAVGSLGDALAGGREPRILAVIDPFTRECPAVRVGTRFTSAEVRSELAKSRGVPREARVDDGPGIAGRMLDLWAHRAGVTPDLGRPGKPADDGLIESFTGRPGEECLNRSYSTGPEDAGDQLEGWRVEYSGRRPDGALG